MASGITNLGEFSARVKATPGELAARVGLVRDRLTLGVHRRVVLETPVDTGFHRASWNASVGQPDESTPGEGGDSYGVPSAPTGFPGADAYTPGWVSNAAPAIVFLNEGSSQQAPAHFVQRAIEDELAALQGDF